MVFYFLVAIFFYVAGYKVREIRAGASGPEYFQKLIKPPKLLYLICASPRLKNYPIGVMVAGGLAGQILGIGFAMYALVFLANPTVMDELGMTKIVLEVVSLIFVIMISFGIPYWLVKKYPYFR